MPELEESVEFELEDLCGVVCGGVERREGWTCLKGVVDLEEVVEETFEEDLWGVEKGEEMRDGCWGCVSRVSG